MGVPSFCTMQKFNRRRKMALNRSMIGNLIQEQIKRCRGPVFVGLKSPKLPAALAEKVDFTYFDNPYFLRPTTKKTCCRIIRGGGFHLTTILERPDDRWKALGIELQPWRKNGLHVVVIPPTDAFVRLYGCQSWLRETMAVLSRVTERPVLVKKDKSIPLEQYLHDHKAHCLVTYGSVAAVEALIDGYPVFSGPICPSRPISAGSLGEIDNPQYHDREPWLHSLAYANWHGYEFPKVNLEDYDYTCAL